MPWRSLLLALSINGLGAAAPAFKAELPELASQAFVGTACLEPRSDQEWVDACLNLNLDQKKLGCRIIAYRIRWFSGSWSEWFAPGVNDLYKKPGETLRRYWACFNDHHFEIIYQAAKGPVRFEVLPKFARQPLEPIPWEEHIQSGKRFNAVLDHIEADTDQLGTLKGGEVYHLEYRRGVFHCTGFNKGTHRVGEWAYPNGDPSKHQISLWGRLLTFDMEGLLYDATCGWVGHLSLTE